MEMMETAFSISHTVKKLFHDNEEINPEAEAIILYPSFGAPLLCKQGQPLQLYVLFERKLYFLFKDEVNKDPQLTNTIKVINKSLKIFPFESGKKNPKEKLFPSDGEAKSNIKVTYLKLQSDLSIEDKKGKLFGYLRKKTNDRYAGHEKGFRYLFLLEISNLKDVQQPGIYDCAWKLYDKKDPTTSMKPALPFPERQDLMARKYLMDGERDNHFIKKLNGYKIDDNFDFAPDDDLPLSNHHVIYISNEDKLNIGQLTDIHVSSRQMALKVCTAQVLPNAGEDISPKIGEMINVSFETFKNLLDQMGKDSEIHMLVLTGDMIDFNQNFDPMSIGESWQDDFKTPAKLWKWMNPNRFDDTNAGQGKPPYPYYIDMITIYSLLHDFVKNHKKPIIMLNGNHEAYDQPYGISPRLYQYTLGDRIYNGSPANEGIPADHNLTVYEATLLYGPAYNDWRHIHNFNAKYLEWFYMMFNPLSDMAITYESQSFTALSWNDSEQLLTNFGGGTLPRANEAVSDAQLKLLKESSRRGQDRILLTHFTFVSYAYNYQITEQGEVNYNNADKNNSDVVLTKLTLMSHYEEGSFIFNRKPVYNMLYDGAFTHVFSGHSHRAGYYVMTEKTGIFSDNVKVQGYPIEEKPISPTKYLKGGKARLIVGASAGPIPGQNHYANQKELGLYTWSLDWPSGNVLKFNGGQDSLQLKPTKNLKAQPRFAVALSFFNTTEIKTSNGAVTGVFQRFESGKKENEFIVELHPALPSEKFIEKTSLNQYKGDNWKQYDMSFNKDNGQQYKSKFLTLSDAEINTELLKEVNPKIYLSVSFSDVLRNKTGYKQYKYNSPWTFPIKFISRQSEAYDTAEYAAMASDMEGYGNSSVYAQMMDRASKTKGYRIQMGENDADFMWYQKNFSEYSTGEVPDRQPEAAAENAVKIPD